MIPLVITHTDTTKQVPVTSQWSLEVQPYLVNLVLANLSTCYPGCIVHSITPNH